eukprot:m.261050 g.261050  ORF g.261050 m.261050 type:complete len:128 (-) comp15571_c0_seq1:596-979(-)
MLGEAGTNKGVVGVEGNNLCIVPPAHGTVMVGEHDLLATIDSLTHAVLSQDAATLQYSSEMSSLKAEESVLKALVSVQNRQIASYEAELSSMHAQLRVQALSYATKWRGRVNENTDTGFLRLGAFRH